MRAQIDPVLLGQVEATQGIARKSFGFAQGEDAAGEYGRLQYGIDGIAGFAKIEMDPVKHLGYE